MPSPRCRHWYPGATVALRAGGAPQPAAARSDGPPVAVRSEGGALPTLAGYAAVFDSWTTLYRSKWYEIREVIRPGAFRNALAEAQDVRALFNHDANLIIGRSTSGTLRLREDAKGLAVEIDPPDDDLGRRVSGLIGRGDVSQMSFAFWPRDGGEVLTIRERDGLELWEIEIKDADLFDVAPVTYPAYQDTSIGQRGFSPAAAERLKRAKGSWLSKARTKSDALARRLAAV